MQSQKVCTSLLYQFICVVTKMIRNILHTVVATWLCQSIIWEKLWFSYCSYYMHTDIRKKVLNIFDVSDTAPCSPQHQSHIPCQFFQIFLENLSLFQNFFFSPTALRYMCVCVKGGRGERERERVRERACVGVSVCVRACIC